MAQILIIDDEEKICEFIAAFLIKDGHSVSIANLGKEGVKKINNENIDLIILDRMIPDISGDEICKTIKNKNINTPIIMITAKTEIDDRVEGFELGCDDYICKPFNRVCIPQQHQVDKDKHLPIHRDKAAEGALVQVTLQRRHINLTQWTVGRS